MNPWLLLLDDAMAKGDKPYRIQIDNVTLSSQPKKDKGKGGGKYVVPSEIKSSVNNLGSSSPNLPTPLPTPQTYNLPQNIQNSMDNTVQRASTFPINVYGLPSPAPYNTPVPIPQPSPYQMPMEIPWDLIEKYGR